MLIMAFVREFSLYSILFYLKKERAVINNGRSYDKIKKFENETY